MSRSRKCSDSDLVRLNSVGLSLRSIGTILGVGPSTVTGRLKALRVEPADTRRSFIEEIWNRMSPEQQDWLASQLGPGVSISDYIHNLLVKEFISRTQ